MAYTYDENKVTKLGQLKLLAQRTKTELDAVNQDLGYAIKYATYANNTLSLFTAHSSSGTPAFAFNLPEEFFLDQAHTEFVGDFEWSSTLYPGSTDPDLDGKPVMVLALKGDATNPTYSFLDMQALVDTYSAADASVVVSGYTIGVQIDDTAGNALTLVSGKGLRVDISGKADKVSGATANDLAKLDSNGNLVDSGIAAADVVTKVASATADDLAALDSNGKLTDSGIAKGNVLVKPTTATAGNLAEFDSNKQPVDSGIAKADVQKKLAANTYTENNFRLSDANGFAKDAGFGVATDTEVADMIHDVWGDPET